MQKINIELAMASLIPEFVYQFLSNEYVDNTNCTCMELEDVRESIKNSTEPELEPVRKFLAIDESEVEAQQRTPEEMLGILDAEIDEVDNEYYHRYTPGELKYVMEHMINNIDIIYVYNRRVTGINLMLSISFGLKSGDGVIDANMVVEFLHFEDKPESVVGGILVGMKDYRVSDSVVARVYLLCDEEHREDSEDVLFQIGEILDLKSVKKPEMPEMPKDEEVH